MKTTSEIYEKINEWVEKLRSEATQASWWTSDDELFRNDQEVEEYCLGVIDALLWVIGDKSGKTI
jgi:hypothetical protein